MGINAEPHRAVSTAATSARRPAALPRILCVDDEPQVLESLQDTLRRRFEVVTTTNEALLEELGALPELPAWRELARQEASRSRR